MTLRFLRKQAETWIGRQDPDFVCAPISEENLFNWTCYIRGPDGTPYAGLALPVLIVCGPLYPWRAPEIYLRHDWHHPNLRPGQIQPCSANSLSLLWNPGLAWPMTLLRWIQDLLRDPNMGQNNLPSPHWICLVRQEIVDEMRRDRAAYNANVRRRLDQQGLDLTFAEAQQHQPPPLDAAAAAAPLPGAAGAPAIPAAPAVPLPAPPPAPVRSNHQRKMRLTLSGAHC